MSEHSAKSIHEFVSPAGVKSIDDWIAKYPVEEKQSAVMSALTIVQEENGYLASEAMDAVADYLGMSPISVYEVASFYTMYYLKPVGRHCIGICSSISCRLKNYTTVVSHLEAKLGIKVGETTPDGRFSMRPVECLGACVHAPVMQIDKDYHEYLTPEKIDIVLEQYP